MQTTLSHTFQETIYLSSDDGDFPASKRWEIEVLVSGCLEPGEERTWDNPGLPPSIDVWGLQVISATCYGWDNKFWWSAQGDALDWIDGYINHRYWFGEIAEGIVEMKVSLAMAE